MKVKKYFRPRDLNEFHRLSAENPDHKILAGGTYVAKMKFPKVDTIIDIQDLGLKGIKEENGDIHIGANVTFTDLIEAELSYCGGLVGQVSSHCGPITIRNIATIGGNVMAGYHWNDTTPLLLALEATLMFTSDSGVKAVPVSSFIANRSTYTGLLLTSIILPSKYKDAKPFYKRFARTRSDIPTSIFIVLNSEEGDHITVGSATVKPVRIMYSADDEFLINTLLPRLNEVKFMDDLRGKPEFKEKIVISQYREWKEK